MSIRQQFINSFSCLDFCRSQPISSNLIIDRNGQLSKNGKFYPYNEIYDLNFKRYHLLSILKTLVLFQIIYLSAVLLLVGCCTFASPVPRTDIQPINEVNLLPDQPLRVRRSPYYNYGYSYNNGRGYGSGYGHGSRHGHHCHNCYRPGRAVGAAVVVGGAALAGGLIGSAVGK